MNKKTYRHNTWIKSLNVILSIRFAAIVCAATFLFASCKDDDSSTTPQQNIIHYTLATAEQGRQFFAKERLHEQITPLFVSLMMKSNDYTYAQWLEFSNTCFTEFSDENRALLASIEEQQNNTFRSLGINIAGLDNIHYIYCTMKNFQNMTAFTSGTHIYVNMKKLLALEKDLIIHVCWHELWHIISRNNPQLRKQMYELIGFHVLDQEIDIPAEVREHILLNPDVERHDSYATFTINGKKTDCMLMLYAPENKYEFWMSLSDYVSLKKGYWLLALDSETHRPYKNDEGKYAVYNCTEVSDFDEVMSDGNTNYCDDPEECMADNFAYAMTNKTVPNPQILADIRRLLQGK